MTNINRIRGGFEYEETEGQLTAVEDKKRHGKPVPMDRLLAAMSASGRELRCARLQAVALKAVAILVPTTILALQHYQTILSRRRASRQGGHALPLP